MQLPTYFQRVTFVVLFYNSLIFSYAMSRLIRVFFLLVLLGSGISVNAQMAGPLTLPGLGGGTNANAGVYSGNGVFVGATGIFSSKVNGVVGAVSWNTGWNFLKGKYTVAIAQPYLMDGAFKNGFYPVTVLSPLQLSWDLNKVKLQGNYSFFFGQTLPLNAHLLTLRYTLYFADNKYSFNGSFVYEIRIEKDIKDREFGNAAVFEANFSRHFKKGTVGIMGYYNTNVTAEYIGGEPVLNDNSTVSGAGIDGNYFISKKFFFNGKYVFDLSRNSALRANKVVFSIIYKI